MGPADYAFTYTNGKGGGALVSSEGYRAINLGFGVEGIDNAADRLAVVERGLAWLGCTPIPLPLRLSKFADRNPVAAREVLTYLLRLENSGVVTLSQIILSDTLPAGTSFAWASDGGGLIGDVVTWSLPDLSPATSLSLTLAITVGPVTTNTLISNLEYLATADYLPMRIRGRPVEVIAFLHEFDIYLPLVLKRW